MGELVKKTQLLCTNDSIHVLSVPSLTLLTTASQQKLKWLRSTAPQKRLVMTTCNSANSDSLSHTYAFTPPFGRLLHELMAKAIMLLPMKPMTAAWLPMNGIKLPQAWQATRFVACL